MLTLVNLFPIKGKEKKEKCFPMCLCFSNGQAFSEASFRSFVWIVRPGNPRETRGRTVTVNVVVLHKEICLVVLKRLLSYQSSSTVVMTSSVLRAFR